MNAHSQRARGFSLIEMMVAVGLLSLVVLVLFSLFNQTTKAMRANSNQTEVMEGARSTLELVGRDLDNMAASGIAGAPNFVTYPTDSGRELFKQSVQQLGPELVPVHQDIFFLQRTDSKRVKVVGYVVRDEEESQYRTLFPVGTLYRYEDPDPRVNGENLSPIRNANIGYLPMVLTAHNSRDIIASRLLDRTKAGLSDLSGPDGKIYRSATLTNLARVVDGVVGFRVTAYDNLNRPLDASILDYPEFGTELPFTADRQPRPAHLAIFDSTNLIMNFLRTGSSIFIQTSRLATDSPGGSSGAGGYARGTALIGSVFTGDYLPTTVEIELALLEPRALDQLRALPSRPGGTRPGQLTGDGPREKYLKNNLGRIHVFRQRVPIRTAIR